LQIANETISSSQNILEQIIKKFPHRIDLNDEDKVILGLYIGIMRKSRSLLILCENNSIMGTDSILRSILEAKVYLEFILDKHTRDRAKAYDYSIKIQNYKRLEWLQVNADNDLLNKAGITEKYIEESKTNDYEKIKEEYFNLTNRYSKGDNTGKRWYKVAGKINTFEDLCRFMSKEHLMEYHIVFKTWSEEVHGRDANRFLELIKANQYLQYDEFEVNEICEWITTFVIEASELIAKKYNVPYGKHISKTLFLMSLK